MQPPANNFSEMVVLLRMYMNKNELVELDWKLDLLSDMKDLHNYFSSQMKTSERINYGDDYIDNFKNYY